MNRTSLLLLTRVAICLCFSNLFVIAWFPATIPEYCSNDMSNRGIPPLTSEQQSQVEEISQVQVSSNFILNILAAMIYYSHIYLLMLLFLSRAMYIIQVVIRHGARTPAHKHACWSGYNVTWNNCNVTQLMLASPSYNSLQRPAKWLFRKLYDGSPNYLGGNCETGQLLLEGYLQHQANGEHLNQAYIGNSLSAMNLFSTSEWDEIDTGSELYLRSDDEERTLLSGQVLMNGMFNVREGSSFLNSIIVLNLNFLSVHLPTCMNILRLQRKLLWFGTQVSTCI